MTQPKHLLHIFPTFAVGGSQMRFAQLVRLHADRYRHTVIALDGNYGMAEQLPPSRVTLGSLEYDKHNLIGCLKAFRTTLKTIQPDVLMTYNWGAVEWAIVNRLGIPVRHLHVEDGFGPHEATRQLRRRVWTRRVALSGRHTTVIFPSQALEAIAQTIWKLPPSRLRLIPNGINYARFAGRSDNMGGTVTIGTVATLRREKNIHRLIEAFEQVKASNPSGQFRLVIVGDGPERLTLQAFAIRLGLSDHVLFTGASTHPEEWLRKMDIFALSSDTEQMPLGILEAMASGLPIAATAVGDIAKMVAEANIPFVVNAGPAFHQALETLAKHASLRQEVGAENAKRAAQLFDERVMAARYAEIIG